MRGDEPDRSRVESGVSERRLHRARGAASLAVRRRHVRRVGGGARAEHATPHACVPARGVLGVLDHDDGGALAEHEAAPSDVEGTRPVGRGTQAVEPRDDEAAEQVGAAGEHHVGAPVPHPVGGERDGLRARRAGELRRHDRAAAGEPARDPHRGRVVRDPFGVADRLAVEPALEEARAAERRAERDAEASGVERRRLEPRVGERLRGRLEGEGTRSIVVGRRDVADLRRGVRVEVVRGKAGDGLHSRARREQPFPEGAQTAAERGHDPAAGDHGGARRTGQSLGRPPRQTGTGAISRAPRQGQSGGHPGGSVPLPRLCSWSPCGVPPSAVVPVSASPPGVPAKVIASSPCSMRGVTT